MTGARILRIFRLASKSRCWVETRPFVAGQWGHMASRRAPVIAMPSWAAAAHHCGLIVLCLGWAAPVAASAAVRTRRRAPALVRNSEGLRGSTLSGTLADGLSALGAFVTQQDGDASAHGAARLPHQRRLLRSTKLLDDDELRPGVHENATLREEVATTVRPLDPGADRMGQGRLDDGEVVGGLLGRPIAER